MSHLWKCAIWAVVLAALCGTAAAAPKMLAYSGSPNSYFDEHASDVAALYDGLFFTVGSWDEGVQKTLGLPGEAPSDTAWSDKVRANVAHLREAGAAESLLGICFNENAEWPSPETLRDKAYTEKMVRHFKALGQSAKELGFRGVSIDIEYPYKRYTLDNPIYTYDGYSAEDLLSAARDQGRACVEAVLDAFPEAVVFVLPGDLLGPPIGHALSVGMLEAMAKRDAPGGLHLGYERSYCLLDPATQVAIPRAGDCAAEALLDGETLAYWKRRCTVAPGVWPLHMVETGGANYPARPWSEELTELDQQLATLRAVAKRYIWSFTSTPVWLPASKPLRDAYGVPAPSFPEAEEAIAGWHRVLRSASQISDPHIESLLESVRKFDRGVIGAETFCGQFGTPGQWMVLGYLSNPFVSPAFASPLSATRPIRLDESIQGRDGTVHWFPFRNYEPTGAILLRTAFGYRRTDDCSVHVVAMLTADADVDAYLWFNYDDGGLVRLDDRVVLDKLAYPERGHGVLYRDRYLFECREPIHIAKGKHRLAVTSVNAKGSWGMTLRVADADAFPIPGISFSLPETDSARP